MLLEGTDIRPEDDEQGKLLPEGDEDDSDSRRVLWQKAFLRVDRSLSCIRILSMSSIQFFRIFSDLYFDKIPHGIKKNHNSQFNI